ncbi:unnamed protein product, partial [Symbiodinium pilosum]
PHLLHGRQPPAEELIPSDGLTAPQRAEARLRRNNAATPAEEGDMPRTQFKLEMDVPLQLSPAKTGGESGAAQRGALAAWQHATSSWLSIHRDLKEIWSKACDPPTRLAKTAAFVGELKRWGSAEGKPHGLGVLLLEDMQHLGRFHEGRADGEGVCLSRSGCVWHGRWTSNLRVGDFVCLDARGNLWLEQYDHQGKRYKRQLIQGSSEACQDAIVKAAVTCQRCGWLHHLQFNHEFACQLSEVSAAKFGAGRDGPPSTGAESCQSSSCFSAHPTL